MWFLSFVSLCSSGWHQTHWLLTQAYADLMIPLYQPPEYCTTVASCDSLGACQICTNPLSAKDKSCAIWPTGHRSAIAWTYYRILSVPQIPPGCLLLTQYYTICIQSLLNIHAPKLIDVYLFLDSGCEEIQHVLHHRISSVSLRTSLETEDACHSP